MAEKKKQKKKQETEKFWDNETLLYISAMILIMLTIIGAMQMGIVGIFLSAICRFLFGTYYGVVYGAFFVYAMLVLFKKTKMPLKLRQVIGILSLLIALILCSAIPKDDSVKGFMILSEYLKNFPEYFKTNPAIPTQGGLLGAFLYSITSLLFDRSGTWVVVVGLVLLAAILLIKKESFMGLNHNIQSAKEKVKLPKKKKQKNLAEDYGLNDVELVKEELHGKNKKAKFLGKVNADDNEKTTSKLDKDIEKIEPEVVVNASAGGISVDEVEVKKEPENHAISTFQTGAVYHLPPLSLLDSIQVKGKSNANATAAAQKGKRLIEILNNFGIDATLIATHIGPAVTKFEIKPDSSVKVNRIMNISDNIKMELAARDIRIEAPIPGRNAVGIEVPNVETTMVKMLELMKGFPADKKDKKMVFVLGKDLMGRCVYCQLDKMPHLLIAGATGSGKSVCMNTIITSFILRCRPDEVKLLLIDPKKVEFTPYHNIPHLIGPVISDANEASRALKVVVEMMENRFEIFSKVGVRNITGYNEKIEKEKEEALTKMPYIVVIIDELADLMMVAGKEVEMSIQRITQLARAAGIHLIVATQRPSTDVITGLIKSNIPSRISFSVSSGIDSRTILDSVGAERLLGNGDMLYLPIGEPSAIRLQGVYVNDDEVKRIADYVSNQYKPMYDDAFIRLEGVDNNDATCIVASEDDPLYDEIKEYVIEAQKASTSLLQRRFGIGYNRAARMIDILEDRGIIGPAQGSKPREVYIKKQEGEHE